MCELHHKNLPLNNELLGFILSHCVKKVKNLVLQNCGITNKLVGEIAERITEREEPVKQTATYEKIIIEL